MTTQRFLTQQDAAKLVRLAEQKLRLRDVAFNLAEDLIQLISSAILLPDNVQRADCVRLNSRVDYRLVGSNEVRSLTIAFPCDGNATLGCHSALMPMAMAFIGRRVSDIVQVRLAAGCTETLEILDVNALDCVGAPA